MNIALPRLRQTMIGLSGLICGMTSALLLL